MKKLRISFGPLVVTLVLPLGIVMPSAQAAPPLHDLIPEVASAHHLVYDEVGVGYFVRSANGRTWQLPNTFKAELGPTSFSLSGHFLTELPGSDQGYAHWWNIKTHQDGVASHGTVAAAQNGWLVEAGARSIIEVDQTGTKKPVTQLPKNWDFPSFVSGPGGVLLYDYTHAEYVPWNRLEHPDTISIHIPANDYLVCENVTVYGAGCAIAHAINDNDETWRAVLLRWSGPNVIAPAPGTVPSPELVGHTLVWWDKSHRKYSVMRSGKVVTIPNHVYRDNPLMAYGRIVLNHGPDRIVAVTPHLKNPTVVVSSS